MEQSTLITRILQSVFFKNAQRNADRYVRDAGRLSQLLKQAVAKSAALAGDKAISSSFLRQLTTLVRMIRAYAKGEYKAIPWRSLLMIVAALIYFVSPLYFIPDLLPLVGLTDDIALVLWVVKSLNEDIERFQEWESNFSATAFTVE
jgi:uncharacterized membrane protein YkvA (DUF1232 family)